MAKLEEEFCENLENAERLKEKLKKDMINVVVMDELVIVLAGLDAQFPIFDTSSTATENEKVRYMRLKEELSNYDLLHLRRLEKDPVYREKCKKVVVDNSQPYHQ